MERVISIKLTLCLLVGWFAVACQAQDRVLERLPNGAQVYAERIADAKTISVQLWISDRGTEETPATNGWRHLIEHFMAKRLDLFTDESGIFLGAETGRQAMAFKFEAAPDKLSFCLEGVRRLFLPITLTANDIEHEIRLIRHEEAGLGGARRFSRAGWSQVFSGSQPDPVGNFDSMAAATPVGLTKLQHRMIAGDNIVLSVCGAVEPRTVVQAISPFLASQLTSSELDSSSPSTANSASAALVSPQAVGSALSVKLEGVDRGSSLARIAVGFAAAQANPSISPIYAVSSQEGLLTLASLSPDIASQVSGLSDRQLVAGIGLLKGWLEGIGKSPSRLASFRGNLLSEGSGLSLDMVKQATQPIGLNELIRAKQEILAGRLLEGFR
ncbi:MAG: insulinase family protein [Fimbriimonadaceae bacterium]|nr:insulinase family protein [Fimbriimonadaceae bacterium]